MRTLGIIGAGKLGTTVGSLAARGGWRVLIAGAPNEPFLELIVGSLIPDAVVTNPARIAAEADLVLLAVPLTAIASMDLAPLAGKTVIDAMNHWAAVDSTLGGLGDHPTTTEWVRSREPRMRVVRSLNHRAYADLSADALAPGHPMRRGILVAADDAEARAAVAALVDDLGFDPVEAPLAASAAFSVNSANFGRPLNAAEIRGVLAGNPAPS